MRDGGASGSCLMCVPMFQVLFVKKQADATEAHINNKRRDFDTVRDMLQHKMKLKASGEDVA